MSEIDFDTKGLETYITDKERESVSGVWLDFPEGRQFLCLRAGGANKKFLRLFQTAIKPHRRQMERGTLDPDKSDALMRDVYAKTIVLDWRGIKDASGKPVPCSQANVIAFFTQFTELFNDLVALCSDMAQFTDEAIEEAKEVLGEV